MVIKLKTAVPTRQVDVAAEATVLLSLAEQFRANPEVVMYMILGKPARPGLKTTGGSGDGRGLYFGRP